jgi:hypothetical protein
MNADSQTTSSNTAQLFSIHRKNSGVGLFGVTGVLAAWGAIGVLMWTSYIAPQFSPANGVQVVTRPSPSIIVSGR